jgi:drug/metabolite transporter (DMT)-like permease
LAQSVDRKTFITSFIWLTICSICWALPPSLGKLTNGTIPPVFIAWFRLLFASVLLVILFIPQKSVRQEFKNTFKLTRNDFLLLFIAGALEGIHYIFYFYSLYYTSAISVSILVNVGEIFVAISGFIFFAEKITVSFIIAIASALLGTLVIVTGGDFGQFGAVFNSASAFGDLLILTSAFLFSIYAVIKKKLIHKTGSIPIVAITFFIGQLVLFPFAIPDILNAANFPIESWGYLILMAIFGSAMGYFAFAQGIKISEMSVAGIITLSGPVFAIMFSLLFVPGEILDLWSIIGAILIILSLFFISLKGKTKNPEEQKKSE